MYKKKKNRFNVRKTYMILLMCATLFMGIGYAAINSVVLDIKGDAVAEVQDGIFITDAAIVNDAGNSSVISGYYQTMLMSNVVLPNASSVVTMRLTIYNSTSDDYTFSKINYTEGDETYSNTNISYSLNGLVYDQMLAAGDSVTFTITFNYVNINNISNYNLKSILNFEFEKYITTKITFDYNYQPNNLFETYFDTSKFKSCCGASEYLKFTQRVATTEGVMFEARMYPFNNFAGKSGEWVRGYYFNAKTTLPLTHGKTYTLTFETKASERFPSVLIGPEQMTYKYFDIPMEWKRHVHTFQANTHDELLYSFVVYDWVSTNRDGTPTIKLRNVQLSEGVLNTKVSTRRAGREIGNVIPVSGSDSNLSRSGWTFQGWYTDPLEGTQVSSSTIVPFSDNNEITYYAHWTYNG